MKIVILPVEHAYANYLTKKLVQRFGSEVKLIGYSDVLLHNKSFLDSLKKYYIVSGIQYIFYQAIKLQIYKIFQRIYFSIFPGKQNHKLFSAKEVAIANKIKINHIKNINSQASVNSIKRIKPDIIVSVFFNQILKDDIIKIASKCAINIHPGYLPDYKGVSPVFWAIANREKQAGFTIHYINSGVDTGEILARKKIAIQRRDTEDSLYWKLTYLGESYLLDIINKLGSKQKMKTIKNKDGGYYSLPTKIAVQKYMKRAGSFFRIGEYLSNK